RRSSPLIFLHCVASHHTASNECRKRQCLCADQEALGSVAAAFHTTRRCRQLDDLVGPNCSCRRISATLPFRTAAASAPAWKASICAPAGPDALDLDGDGPGRRQAPFHRRLGA
ncbi:uncharacterized protein BJ171DRAFT_565743, partial [Polychytrium aggregatum]|uniref:uncharacterized protein n=1 Tax=Polychytrium aggregatum TaxID=110093 RepID=UPI0022FE0079